MASFLYKTTNLLDMFLVVLSQQP